MMRFQLVFAAFAIGAVSLCGQTVYDFPDLEVSGRETSLVGEAISASQGVVGRMDLEVRPMLRVGEILETVPGMIATQHSGSGKANQYFLRGFNLDHGTDFATWIDGMPVNMVSHGHGQGYTDLNFIIPELVSALSYLKGSYYAGVGDFSSAGSAQIKTLNTFEESVLKVSIGEFENYRLVVADSIDLEKGSLLYGFEHETNDGPWELDENLERVNGVLKYSFGDSHQSTSITFMGYDATWDSTDQIPGRAVLSGQITDLGFIDDTVGGESSRYSLSTNWRHDHGSSVTQASAYAIAYDMNLWSNFTYFLEDPVNGDQFEQADKRMIYGFTADHAVENAETFGNRTVHIFGVQTRFDDVENVGLYNTSKRSRLSTNREDSLEELSVGLYYDAEINWSSAFTTSIGIRGDYYDFSVNSDNAANSGSGDDFILSPKLRASYSVNEQVDLYLSVGYGFHSNDARGVTISVDPVDGTPVNSVDALAASEGAEIGLRYALSERFNTSIAFWGLELDSELIYVGDAGNTESSRPSRRKGLEVASYYRLNDWVSFDFDFALTDAEFSDSDPGGTEIPGAIDRVASAGLSFSDDLGWFGALRFRHFGERPLIEDNSVQSDSFSAFNMRLGYREEAWELSLDLLNLLDADDQDITYFYESRLENEAVGGVEDRHYHRIPPMTLKANFTLHF